MERLIQKLSVTCRSHLDEEREKERQRELQEKINGKVRSSTARASAGGRPACSHAHSCPPALLPR